MVKTLKACGVGASMALLLTVPVGAQPAPGGEPGLTGTAVDPPGSQAAAQQEAAASPQPAESATAPEPAAGGPAPAAPQPGSYTLKLREIEERVNELKEKIFQSKARLIQLQEVVLHGAISGAKAVIVHHNEMGGSFKLWRVQYALDGTPIFNRVDNDTGELANQDEIEIFNGSVAPGNHQVSVYLEYRGGGFGFFNYLDEFKFNVKSRHTFRADEGKVTTVRVIGYEKGGLTTKLQDKPMVRYEVETERALREASEEGEPEAE